MRRSFALAVACCALGAGIAQAREFPYSAVVVADEAYARSGPGTGYYETLRLHKGDKVLVQRHDPGGWFAIAPPEGSFSWVKESEVRKEASGVGIIIGRNVEVRVGSLKSVDKSFHQVRLSEGAQVKILDERQTSNGKWYRIAPPTGELRWIAGRDVTSEDGPQQNLPDRAAPRSASSTATQPYAPEATKPYPSEAERPASTDEEQADRLAPRVAERAESDVGSQPIGRTNRIVAKPATSQRRPEQFREKLTPQLGEPEVRFDPSPMLIAEANRELVAMIRQDIALWDFSGIRQRYEEARDRAATSSGRANALERLDHLARYERIKANHDGFQSALARSRSRDRAVQAAQERQRDTQSPPRPRYDGTGVLRRAPFQGAGAPRYVLTDAHGNVRYYITPGAGVELHPYLDQAIAVYGTQSYRADLLAHQITVRQVLPVEPVQKAETTYPDRF